MNLNKVRTIVILQKFVHKIFACCSIAPKLFRSFMKKHSFCFSIVTKSSVL